jgi:hypothetical protein
MNRAKSSKPAFSENLIINGADIIISMKTAAQILACILKARAAFAFRNTYRCMLP